MWSLWGIVFLLMDYLDLASTAGDMIAVLFLCGPLVWCIAGVLLAYKGITVWIKRKLKVKW